jgi:hypothetical protein
MALTLFDCKDTNEILNKGYEDALILVTKAIDEIMIGGNGGSVTKSDLVISKLLGQNLELPDTRNRNHARSSRLLRSYVILTIFSVLGLKKIMFL